MLAVYWYQRDIFILLKIRNCVAFVLRACFLTVINELRKGLFYRIFTAMIGLIFRQ